MTRKRVVLGTALAAVVLVLLGACGVPTDETATPLGADELPESLRPAAGEGSTTTMAPDDSSTVPVYLVRPAQQEGESTVLEQVRRTVTEPNLRTALLQLFEPVPESEAPLASQWATAEIQLTDVIVDTASATATIVLTDLPQVTGDLLKQAVAQMVFTASEFTDVDVVQIQLGDGALIDLPFDGGFSSRVTTADYASLDPALVPTSPPVVETTTSSPS